MDLTTLRNNATDIDRDFDWLWKVIDTRIKLFFEQETGVDIYEIAPPDLADAASLYADILRHYAFSFEERLTLLMALAPHLKPGLLDIFFIKNATYDRGFTEFGGIKGQMHSGFLPTGETVAFILAGNTLEKRFHIIRMFEGDHYFRKFNILKLSHSSVEEPFMSGALSISNEYLNYFINGISHKPDFSANFPAKLMETHLSWDDLVLDDHVMEEVAEIKAWIQHGHTLLHEWGLKKRVKPGFRSLFYGPPGTGKTFTATLLGKNAALDVYRIDLSQIVSKYIGETEKNLSGIFDQAENKNWILFFDEADALFGKRTVTSSSNDRYANQEVSYLLQRIEDFPGVIILATNFKANIDDAFSRRFQSMIYFPVPAPEQRLVLWQKAFSDQSVLEKAVNLEDLARKYELTGGAIINVLRYSSLMALQRGNNIILLKDIVQGIRKEFSKEGKTV